VELQMQDFDRLTSIHLDLRDADLFLGLLDDVAMEAPWKTYSVTAVAREKVASALAIFERMHGELRRRLRRKPGLR
jgi:hypothetical protein